MYFFLLLFSKVSWYKDGRAVHYDKTHLADQHGSLFMLRLKEITINDLGNYTCEAENSQGLARDHIELSGIIKKIRKKNKIVCKKKRGSLGYLNMEKIVKLYLLFLCSIFLKIFFYQNFKFNLRCPMLE